MKVIQLVKGSILMVFLVLVLLIAQKSACFAEDRAGKKALPALGSSKTSSSPSPQKADAPRVSPQPIAIKPVAPIVKPSPKVEPIAIKPVAPIVKPSPKVEPIVIKPVEPLVKPSPKVEPIVIKPVEPMVKPSPKVEPIVIKPVEPMVKPSPKVEPIVIKPVEPLVKPSPKEQPIVIKPVEPMVKPSPKEQPPVIKPVEPLVKPSPKVEPIVIKPEDQKPSLIAKPKNTPVVVPEVIKTVRPVPLYKKLDLEPKPVVVERKTDHPVGSPRPIVSPNTPRVMGFTDRNYNGRNPNNGEKNRIPEFRAAPVYAGNLQSPYYGRSNYGRAYYGNSYPYCWSNSQRNYYGWNFGNYNYITCYDVFQGQYYVRALPYYSNDNCLNNVIYNETNYFDATQQLNFNHGLNLLFSLLRVLQGNF